MTTYRTAYESRSRWQHVAGDSADTYEIYERSPGTFRHNVKQGNFCQLCGAWRGAFGLEPTPELYIQHSVEILREIRRVLRPDGVVFWNIGDSYAGSGGAHNENHANPGISNSFKRQGVPHYGNLGIPERYLAPKGMKPLDLCLIPERLAIALQTDGWYVRSIIIWHKANPMPESVNGWRWERHRIKVKSQVVSTRGKATGQYQDGTNTRIVSGLRAAEYGDQNTEWQDCPGCLKCSPNGGYVLRKGSWRPTDSYEQILMLTKTANYYCDAEAVREAQTEGTFLRYGKNPKIPPKRKWSEEVDKGGSSNTEMQEHIESSQGMMSAILPNGRNLRNVWSFPTVPYPGAHFAVFPEKLPELCIKAATPEVGVCAKCGAPWARIIEKGFTEHDGQTKSKSDPSNKGNEGAYGRLALLRQGARERGFEYSNDTETLGWWPTCSCNCPDTIPAKVLDPFAGAGTTLLAAIKLGRNAIGYEISKDYCAMTNKRINEVQIRFS